MSATRPLVTGTYTATPEFAEIREHEAVLFADTGRIVALTGPAGDPETQRYAKLFAGAEAMLEALRDAPTPNNDEPPEFFAARCLKWLRTHRDSAIAAATGGEP